MTDRSVVLVGLVAVLATGCGVQRLPPASPPAKVVPTDVDVPSDPPAAGTGRVILDTNGEPARVVEITGAATASNGAYSATIVGIRPLCTTPCVVDLPYGSHPLVLHSISDETHLSETEIEVGARAKVFRHTLGERKDGGPLRTAGSSLLTLGVIAVTTGAILWLAGSASHSGSSSLTSNGQLVTGLGAGGILLSIPFPSQGGPPSARAPRRSGTSPAARHPSPPRMLLQEPRWTGCDRLRDARQRATTKERGTKRRDLPRRPLPVVSFLAHFGPTPSTRHAAEQPSPFVRLPSSHCSGPLTMPSPQRGPRTHSVVHPS